MRVFNIHILSSFKVKEQLKILVVHLKKEQKKLNLLKS